MYARGDQIIHPRFGAGIIAGKKKQTFQGRQRSYYILELVGNRGEVMIPVEIVKEMNIRPAITDLSIIKETFAKPPSELPPDYRERQNKIRKEIETRKPEAMAKVLRDLYWREQGVKLTSVETKIKSDLLKRLSHEMAVMRPETTVKEANSQLLRMLQVMIETGTGLPESAEASA